MIGRNQDFLRSRPGTPPGPPIRLRLDQHRPDLQAPRPDHLLVHGDAATGPREARPDRLRCTPFASYPGSSPIRSGSIRDAAGSGHRGFALLALVSGGLVSAGYRAIGMVSRFALPQDELSLALDEHAEPQLHGLHHQAGTETIALGTSGISGWRRLCPGTTSG